MFPVAASILLTLVVMKMGLVCNNSLAEFLTGKDPTFTAQGQGEDVPCWLRVWYDFTPDTGQNRPTSDRLPRRTA
jgi:hypothetical protein